MAARLTQSQKLKQRLEPLLTEQEQLRGAFIVNTGPRPGVEAILGPLLGVLGAIGVAGSRKRFAVAVTDNSVRLWRMKGLRNDISALEHRYEGHEAFGQLQGSGDRHVDIDGAKHWVLIMWTDEVNRVNRLLKPKPRSGT